MNSNFGITHPSDLRDLIGYDTEIAVLGYDQVEVIFPDRSHDEVMYIDGKWQFV